MGGTLSFPSDEEFLKSITNFDIIAFEKRFAPQKQGYGYNALLADILLAMKRHIACAQNYKEFQGLERNLLHPDHKPEQDAVQVRLDNAQSMRGFLRRLKLSLDEFRAIEARKTLQDISEEKIHQAIAQNAVLDLRDMVDIGYLAPSTAIYATVREFLGSVTLEQFAAAAITAVNRKKPDDLHDSDLARYQEFVRAATEVVCSNLYSGLTLCNLKEAIECTPLRRQNFSLPRLIHQRILSIRDRGIEGLKETFPRLFAWEGGSQKMIFDTIEEITARTPKMNSRESQEALKRLALVALVLHYRERIAP